MDLRHARPDDLAFIVATESLPEHAPWINRWPRERHAQAMADPDYRYLLFEDLAEPAGYAILAGLTSPNRAIELVRVALAKTGSGQGRRCIRLLMTEAFEQLAAHRFHLDLFEDNARAEHLYRSLGFAHEGVLRDAQRRGERFRSLKLMAILEDDYRRGVAGEAPR